MKVVIYAIVLVAVFARCASCQKLKQCRERCITKIPDIQLCNETCVQLVNSSSASNITASPPVPDSPRLLSSTYFTLTLQWNDYTKTKYNASPVVYVLETTRHKNSSDPAIILPAIKKYHTTNSTTFTNPEQFVTKTNFSFRLAVVTVQGTSDFSPPSPLYITNDTCNRSEHLYNPGAFNPCPVFNVRINFTATEVLFREPRISSVLFWDYPHDIANLEYQLTLKVELSNRFPYTRVSECAEFGTSSQEHYISPHSQSRSEIYHLPPEDRLYFGCPYDITLHPFFSHEFNTVATFYVPHCIHGFCGCDFVTSNAPKRESEYIDVNVRQSNHSENKTTANVTWRNEAWGTKVPEYFRLFILECPRGTCPSPHLNHKREILLADRMKTSNSFISQNLTKGEEHWVIIAAYDKSGCLLTPTESQLFDAIVPLSRTTAPITTVPSTEYSTVKSSTLLSSPATPRTECVTVKSSTVLSGPATPSTEYPTVKSSTLLSSPATPSTEYPTVKSSTLLSRPATPSILSSPATPSTEYPAVKSSTLLSSPATPSILSSAATPSTEYPTVKSSTLLSSPATPSTEYPTVKSSTLLSRPATPSILSSPATPSTEYPAVKSSTLLSSPATPSMLSSPATPSIEYPTVKSSTLLSSPATPSILSSPATPSTEYPTVKSSTLLSSPTTPSTRPGQTTPAYSFLCYKCEERENYSKEQCDKNQKTIECQANLKVTCFKQHIVKNDGTELEFRGCEHKSDCETRRKNCEDEAKMKELGRKECGAACCITDGDTPCNSGVTVPVNMIMVMVVTAACSLRLALG